MPSYTPGAQEYSPIITSFTPTPTAIDPGGSVVLNWVLDNSPVITSAIITWATGSLNITSTPTGSSAPIILNVTTVFTLTATNSNGTEVSYITSIVIPVITSISNINQYSSGYPIVFGTNQGLYKFTKPSTLDNVQVSAIEAYGGYSLVSNYLNYICREFYIRSGISGSSNISIQNWGDVTGYKNSTIGLTNSGYLGKKIFYNSILNKIIIPAFDPNPVLIVYNYSTWSKITNLDIGGDSIEGITFDSTGKMWVCTRSSIDHGLDSIIKYDLSINTKLLGFRTGITPGLIGYYHTSMVMDSSNNLYIATGNTISSNLLQKWDGVSFTTLCSTMENQLLINSDGIIYSIYQEV